MKSFLSAAFLLLAGLLAAKDYAITDLKQWKLQDLSAEVISNDLRLREIGPKAYGTARLRINVGKNKYLQITAGASENPEHYVSISNVSLRTTPKGVLFQGVNTFRLPEKNFTLALLLRGNRGTATGGWYDIANIRTTDRPLGGVTVSAAKKVLEVNDSFTVRYYAEKKMPSARVPVKTFLSSNMSAVSFGENIILNDDGVNGDEKAGDLVYSAAVKITSQAHNIGQAEVLFALTGPDGCSSYGTPDFAFNIKTARNIQKTLTRLSPRAANYRAMWENAVAGKVNLAAGKKVEFSIPPNFHITSVGKNRKLPNRDQWDLTDGQLTRRGDDVLRFDHQAVGWRSSADLSGGIDIVTDLGKTEPVEKVVIRINCGDRQKQVQRSPRKLAVLVSEDGKLFYPAGQPMIKLQPGEKDQSNFVDQFYLEEDDQNIFCYPFELKVNAFARYVMVRIVPDGGNLYSDEMAVIKAADLSKVSRQAYSGQPEKRLVDGIVLSPAQRGNFYIASNIPAPNYIAMRDLRTKPGRTALQMVLELPAGIICLNPKIRSEKIKLNDRSYVRYVINLPENSSQIPRFLEHYALFLQAASAVPAGSKGYFYALINGQRSHVTERPIEVIAIPESTEMFKGITVLSRMGIGNEAFPGYFDHLKKMGFSGVQIYPYMYQRQGVDKFPESYCQAIDTARRHNYKLVMGYNGLLDMYRYSPHKGDVYCQGITPKNVMCPSYRGKYYHDELAKITRSTAKFRPDYIQWDIEIWGRSMSYVRQCTRCGAMQKKSGKNWPDFLDDLSVELNADLNNAVAKGARTANAPMPLLYNYNRQPVSKIYHGFEKWSLNGKFVDGGQPSLYVAGNELRVRQNIRRNFRLQGHQKRILIPILTPGTYGAYEPYHLEQMIYETMLNGAKGFFYYPWRGFISPIYFYYHAKAMKNIIKYQDLILNGTVYTPERGNTAMSIAGVKNANEALILIGNYHSSDKPVRLTAPFDNAEVLDVLNNQKLSAEEVKNLRVPVKKVSLLYFRKK